ncbi:MAG: hypothetical protein ACRD9R_09280 [Pyrinomonadaceae bacterium]
MKDAFRRLFKLSRRPCSPAWHSAPRSAPKPKPRASLLIKEFRLSGPGGNQVSDEYVELYNNSGAPLNINQFKLETLDELGNVVPRDFASPDTIIPSRGHYLVVNLDGYSLINYAPGDVDVGDGTGIDLFINNQGVRILSQSNVQIDTVGFTGNDPNYVEGVGLSPQAASPAEAHAYVRKLVTGVPQDTGDNAADFVLVSTTGVANGAQLPLGAPGPEDSFSPIQSNSVIKASLIDPQQPSTAAPNRVRVGSGNAGSLLIRRRFTNNTSDIVTQLRFRVMDITTLNNRLPAEADVRAATSADGPVTITMGGTVTLQPLTLEEPPAQPLGGGLNSSVAASIVTGGAPLGDGATIDVEFQPERRPERPLPLSGQRGGARRGRHLGRTSSGCRGEANLRPD